MRLCNFAVAFFQRGTELKMYVNCMLWLSQLCLTASHAGDTQYQADTTIYRDFILAEIVISNTIFHISFIRGVIKMVRPRWRA